MLFFTTKYQDISLLTHEFNLMLLFDTLMLAAFIEIYRCIGNGIAQRFYDLKVHHCLGI